jgi:cell division septation protein DedD
VPAETTVAPVTQPPASVDSVKLGFTVSFAVFLDEPRARDEASKISVNGQTARVVTSMTNGTTVFRVVLGPYPTRDEADRAGRAANHSFVIYSGTP